MPKAQRSKPLTLARWLDTTESRDEALLWAHTKSGISMTAIADEMDYSVSYVSRLIKRRGGTRNKAERITQLGVNVQIASRQAFDPLPAPAANGL